MKSALLQRAERAVIRAAVGCIDKRGRAYTIATEQIARTFYVNELALQRLEHAVAKLKDARKKK